MIVQLFGCDHLLGSPHVRNYWHPNSHVGRFFNRELKQEPTPEENRIGAIATAAFLERVRLRLAAAEANKSASNGDSTPPAPKPAH